jgi:hypothetical protein
MATRGLQLSQVKVGTKIVPVLKYQAMETRVESVSPTVSSTNLKPINRSINQSTSFKLFDECVNPTTQYSQKTIIFM